MIRRATVLSCVLVACAAVSPLQAKEMYEIWLEFMAGEWTVVEPAVGGECVFLPHGNTGALTIRGQHNDGFRIHGIIGRYPDFKMFVETDFMTGQGRTHREYTVVNDKVLRGTYKNDNPGGNGHGTIEYRRIDDNTMELSLTQSEETEPWGRVKFVRKNAP